MLHGNVKRNGWRPPNSKKRIPSSSRKIFNAYNFCKRGRNAVLSRGVSSLVFVRLQSAQVTSFYRSLVRTPNCSCKTFSVSLLVGPEVPEVFPEVPLCVRKFRTLSGSSGHLSCNGQFLEAEYKQILFHLPTVAADIHFDQTPAKSIESLSKPFKASQAHIHQSLKIS